MRSVPHRPRRVTEETEPIGFKTELPLDLRYNFGCNRSRPGSRPLLPQPTSQTAKDARTSLNLLRLVLLVAHRHLARGLATMYKVQHASHLVRREIAQQSKPDVPVTRKSLSDSVATNILPCGHASNT